MADLSQNITNAVNCFGGGPTTKWGSNTGPVYTMTWGTSVWGESNSLPLDFIKVISESVSGDSTIELYKAFVQNVTSTVSPTSDMVTENLLDGSWYYVFPGGVTDNEDQSVTTWTNSTDATPSFTCATVPSTTWS